MTTKMITAIYKPIGLTPLEAIKKADLQSLRTFSNKVSYLGRLDPMAHGLMLVGGNLTKESRQMLLSLDKSYQFIALLGISTDTYDLLGLPSGSLIKGVVGVDHLELLAKWQLVTKLQNQSYPPYSSKTVLGKPLYYWARNELLDKITIPTKKIVIYSDYLRPPETISVKQFLEQLEARVMKVVGDFRQQQTLAAWHQALAKYKKTSLHVVRGEVHCSSGTYLRGLVHTLGQELGVGALVLEILRTQVGEFKLDEGIGSYYMTGKINPWLNVDY